MGSPIGHPQGRASPDILCSLSKGFSNSKRMALCRVALPQTSIVFMPGPGMCGMTSSVWSVDILLAGSDRWQSFSDRSANSTAFRA